MQYELVVNYIFDFGIANLTHNVIVVIDVYTESFGNNILIIEIV